MDTSGSIHPPVRRPVDAGGDPPWLVALASSAGGVAATRAVLEAFPPALSATVIVALHRSPLYSNQLAELFGRWCHLRVTRAQDGAVLTAGRVLVVPSGCHAIVTSDGCLCVFPADGPPLYRPSADLLLASMAAVAPSRSLGVILSGTGHDGAAGASALRHLGGIVIATDEPTSEQFAMPSAAIARGAVDAVLPLPQVAPFIEATVMGRVRRAPPAAHGPSA